MFYTVLWEVDIEMGVETHEVAKFWVFVETITWHRENSLQWLRKKKSTHK